VFSVPNSVAVHRLKRGLHQHINSARLASGFERDTIHQVIPGFDADGFLPPGVHPATFAEIRDRFGTTSEIRRAQTESIGWLIELAARAGALRIILNGSFVTNIIEPNDVDCVLLIAPGASKDPAAEDELAQGLPFLDIALVGQKDFDYFVNRFFAVNRMLRIKGMIEVVP